MSDLLRVYGMKECDARGVPLDWERCRTCNGGKSAPQQSIDNVCCTCGGHGSLKVAVREGRLDLLHQEYARRFAEDRSVLPPRSARCEACAHPMGEPEWDYGKIDRGLLYDAESVHRFALDVAMSCLVRGEEPPKVPDGTVHYTPCDERCKHKRIGRYRFAGRKMDANGPGPWKTKGDHPRPGTLHDVQASWRQVDVRTLDWPHDLRAESVAVLCLRCYAETK